MESEAAEDFAADLEVSDDIQKSIREADCRKADHCAPAALRETRNLGALRH